jgi:hypothetical protein
MNDQSNAAFKAIESLLERQGHRGVIKAIQGHENQQVPAIAATELAEVIDRLIESLTVVKVLAEADRAHVISEYLGHIATTWRSIELHAKRSSTCPKTMARNLALAEDAGHKTGPDMWGFAVKRLMEEQKVPRRPTSTSNTIAAIEPPKDDQ